ncbi:MAG: radical SAM protein [Phycisphaerae bacterium]|nr:radical SAM protein [Phycisphaerae bacterium]
MTPPPTAMPPGEPLPRLVALEVTRRCVLTCRHCRAAAAQDAAEDELTGQEWTRLLENLAGFARPTVILTGGEPLLRDDVTDIAARASGLGLRVVLATCGALLDHAAAARLSQAGVAAISVSLDGATAASHDAFRGQAGTFTAALQGIESARQAGLPFQINTTVTRRNVAELPAILDLAAKLGAKTFNPFLLVPTGRGRQLASEALSAEEYEQTLNWLAEQQARGEVPIRVTCAPHFQRILQQRGQAAGLATASPRGAGPATKGCLGGRSFAFVSHRGTVQACGFLEVAAGDLREADYDFATIWRTSPVFAALRDRTRYGGRCGVCEFHTLCGGCRARAWAASGDYLAEEPLCLHQPRGTASPGAPKGDVLDATDARLIWAAQTQFPIVPRPFELLGRGVGIESAEAMARLRRLREEGIIRRIGAVFDPRRLGYVSTLVTARVPADRLAEVAGIVGTSSGVTHNYSRRHRYNLWFTLTAPDEVALERALADLWRRSGIDELRALPAERVYKIHAVFLPPGLEIPPAQASAAPLSQEQKAVKLDAAGRRMVRRLAGDLPPVELPFDALAAELGQAIETLLHQVKAWLAEGVVRRFGAVVSHRRLGYVTNGMAVFAVPPERIDEVGQAAAQRPGVSHCYRRRPFAGFPYNLFAMIHGHSDQEVRSTAQEIATAAGLSEYDVLMTDQEFKKTSGGYFA